MLVVDDHPAVLNGLVGALRSEPGLVPVAIATATAGALRQVARMRPDVVLVDYHLGDEDGLRLCHELKLLRSPPAVVIYSAFAGTDLRLAASVAGADGLLDKGAPLEDLYATIRAVAKGAQAMPPLRPAVAEASVARLDPEDLPILGMRMDGVAFDEIAAVLRLDKGELSRRVRAMLRRLAAPLDTRVRA